MTDTVLVLLAWIAMHTGYEVDLPQPNIVMTTEGNLCKQYGIDSRSQCEGMRLIGFYNKGYTIYLDVDFDIRQPNQRSHLLHELVHYVQYQNKEHLHVCLGHLELEAYELQDQWRKSRQLQPVLGDFNRLMLEMSCET
jgi:hypothetical protein